MATRLTQTGQEVQEILNKSTVTGQNMENVFGDGGGSEEILDAEQWLSGIKEYIDGKNNEDVYILDGFPAVGDDLDDHFQAGMGSAKLVVIKDTEDDNLTYIGRVFGELAPGTTSRLEYIFIRNGEAAGVGYIEIEHRIQPSPFIRTYSIVTDIAAKTIANKDYTDETFLKISDAANEYLKKADAENLYIRKSGGSFTGDVYFAGGLTSRQGRFYGIVTHQANVDMDGHKIQNLAAPTSANDAATKAYVDYIASLGIELVPVDVLPEASASTMGKIYLVPSTDPQTANSKDEFITFLEDDVYDWEQIGSTAIDLSGYMPKSGGTFTGDVNIDESNLYVKGQITVEGGEILMTDDPSSEMAAINKGYVDDGLSGKQDTLVSGTNIKTINGLSIIGSGELTKHLIPSSTPPSKRWIVVPQGVSVCIASTHDTLLLDSDANMNVVHVLGGETYEAKVVEYQNEVYLALGEFGDDDVYVFPIRSITELKFNKIDVVSDSDFDVLATVAVKSYQDKLVSGTNIKTINNINLLGSGNINIQSEDEIFYAQHNVTPYLDVLTAFNAGKRIIMWYYRNVDPETGSTKTYIPLVDYKNYEGEYGFEFCQTNFNTTIFTSLDREGWDSISEYDNGEVFVATYGSTTYQQIVDAYNAGKICICQYDNRLYVLDRIIAGNLINFASVYQDTVNYLIVYTTNGWATGYKKLEDTSNKKSSWSSTPSNTNYPTEKLVKDTIDALPVIPSGGTTGQVLAKASGTDYDVEWTNGGGGDSDVFDVVYGTTTSQQILDAASAGKILRCVDNGITHYYGGNDGNYHYFFAIISNIAYKRITVAFSNSGYARHNLGVQGTANKVTSWSATPNNTNYPTEKLVKDSIDAVDKVFWATYGSTTAAEMDAAIASGKAIYVKFNNRVYTFTGKLVGASTYDFYWFISVQTTQCFSVRLRSDNNQWQNLYNDAEKTDNKVSTLSGNETNTTKYPNTKAVADALDTKQAIISAVNVSVSDTTGTPSATASVSGSTMNLSFTGIKGEKGDTGEQGQQGNTGSSVDYPYELVNNLTTDDATKGLSAAQGVVLEGEISQLGQALINYARVEGTRLIFGVSPEDETDGYIYEGLVMRLDGIRKGNAEGAWKDLVGGIFFNNNGCIFNTDNVQFPSDSWGYLTGLMQGVPSATGTIEIVFEADNLSGGNRFLFYPSTAGCLCVAYANSLNTFIWGITDTYARTMYTPSKLSGKTVVSFNGLAGGVQDKSALLANGVNSFGDPTDTTYIGRRGSSTASQKFVGKIYAIRIYSRQLTVNEILHNQQIDNDRFNLGLQ